MGGAAILLSNKFFDGFQAKYKLYATVRVHKAANDEAYRAVYQEQDDRVKNFNRKFTEISGIYWSCLVKRLDESGWRCFEIEFDYVG